MRMASQSDAEINPLALDVLQPNDWRMIDGHDVEQLRGFLGALTRCVRAKVRCFLGDDERLSSHTSSDDQKLYRSAVSWRCSTKKTR